MARHPRGAILIWVTLAITLLLGVVALALNVGHGTAVKGELQDGVDAAALAGAIQLSGEVSDLTPSTTAATNFASYHFTDTGTQMAADRVLLGEWRNAARAGCEPGDTVSGYADSSGAHFCTVTARDAAAAFRINAVYARSQRASGAVGGGALPAYFRTSAGQPAGMNVTAEAIAITGGSCGSSCLNVPLVVGVGCLTGTNACPVDAPPDSLGPTYPMGLSSTTVRSTGWSDMTNDPNGTSDPSVCQFLRDANGGCSSISLGQQVQVETGQGNKFSGGCNGGGNRKICDWFKAFVGRNIEVPVVSFSGNLSEACPSTYNASAYVVGFSTYRVTAVNCNSGCVGDGCAGGANPCAAFAASECIVTRRVCNHENDTNHTTGCAWTGTSDFHPVLVQVHGATGL
jgi:Flp pilus assembly protein TadG